MHNFKSQLKAAATIIMIMMCLPLSAQMLNHQVPDIVFTDRQGERVALEELQGNHVLLHFWASWCPVGVLQLPSLAMLYNKYAQSDFDRANGFEIVMVALEDASSLPEWHRLHDQYGFRWKSVYVDKSVDKQLLASLFHVSNMPTSMLVDPDGVVVAQKASLKDVDQLLSTQTILPPHIQNLGYQVALGSFHSLQVRDFSHISHLGKLEKNYSDSGMWDMYIGTFYDMASADIALKRAKEAGYYEARLITLQGDVRTADIMDVSYNVAETHPYYYQPAHEFQKNRYADVAVNYQPKQAKVKPYFIASVTKEEVGVKEKNEYLNDTPEVWENNDTSLAFEFVVSKR